MRKLFLLLMVTVSAGWSQIPATAQERVIVIPPAVIKTLDQEPPLSQADIDAYVKIIPELLRLQSDSQSPEQLASKLASSLNLSQLRFSYIMVKVPLTMLLASGGDPKSFGMDSRALDSLLEALRPSDQELSLVKDNLETLVEAAGKANQSLR